MIQNRKCTQNKSAPQQSCAALKIMLHVLLKGFLDLASLLEKLAAPKRRLKGFVSNKRVHFEPERIKSDLYVLNLTFFEKDAAIPTHLGVPSFQ